MKLRPTTPASDHFLLRVGVVAIVIVMAVTLPIQFFAGRPAAADDFDAQISAIQREVSGFEKEANALRKQADTLQNTIAQLQNDTAKIQAQITLSQAQHDKLVEEIKQNEEQIEENRKTSGDLIVTSTLSGDVPLIVRLAASDNLADYIEGEAHLNNVRDTIVQKTEEIEVLRAELVKQREEVQKVLTTQNLQRQELVSKQQTQQQLLAETKGNEAAYQDRIKESRSEIADLRRMQEELRNRPPSQSPGVYIPVTGGGGYPWAGVGYPCWSASCADPWGLYYRECTSYTAWKLASQGYGVKHFSGSGHAYEWPSTTRGYTTQKYGTNPRAGDAAVLGAGVGGAAWTGHVMYVEEVYGNGDIRISEYNWNGAGQYGERRLNSSEYSVMTFITFPRT